MKKFAVKSILLALILSVPYLMITLSNLNRFNVEASYMSAILDKHERLVSASGSRLIVVGGSNLAFGLDSEMLERELGMYVANMGLHAGLGANFMINEIISEIRSGDVILLCFEYPLYSGNEKPDVMLLNLVQHIYPPAQAYYDFGPIEYVKFSFQTFRRAFIPRGPLPPGVYMRENFNKDGDMNYVNLIKRGSIKCTPTLEQWTLRDLQPFEDLVGKCKQMNARAFIMFPCYSATQYDMDRSKIEKLYGEIKSELTYIPILGTPESFIVSDADLFDTIYHPNADGRQKRTMTMVELLKPIL
jgi:hypothetical protein